MVTLRCLLVCLVAGVLSDIDSPGCGTNDVGFDYGSLPKHVKRIVGGEIAKPHSFPWMASLQKDGKHYCGGALLKGAGNKWYIVTSAHCIYGSIDSEWKVMLGVHDLSKPESTSQTINVTAHMTHPSYDRITLQYDIGLLQLASAPDVQRTGINFGCMTSNLAIAGEHCYVIGWGSNVLGGPPSDFLRVVDKPVMSESKCNSLYSPNYHAPSMICAGYELGGKDACSHDSGGPLMCYRNNHMEIMGTVSWSVGGCADPNSPAVYSRGSAAVQWIQHTIMATP